MKLLKNDKRKNRYKNIVVKSNEAKKKKQASSDDWVARLEKKCKS